VQVHNQKQNVAGYCPSDVSLYPVNWLVAKEPVADNLGRGTGC
jgi:hypothetical protein